METPFFRLEEIENMTCYVCLSFGFSGTIFNRGRFGRGFHSAPDLKSSIISLINAFSHFFIIPSDLPNINYNIP